MRIEIITTGDEVMQGIIVDTNTSWIAGRCTSLGHVVTRHSSVGDEAVAIASIAKEASGRADAVIVTGGLGPTSDDITVEAAAGAFGRRLAMDEGVLSGIRCYFEESGRTMSQSNEKQAMIPEGGIVLPNRVGTAPGIEVKLGDAEFFFLPGVPKELYQIFDDSVMPWLAARSEGAFCEKVLRCFGIPEASIDEKLRGADLGGARLSYRVCFPEILLQLIARADDRDAAVGAVGSAAREIRSRLGDVVYAEGDATLAKTVGEMLRSRGMTFAVAESCTGGLVASMMTDTPGSSEYFERGVVAYSNRSKMEVLDVSEKILKAHGAVSAEVASSMADGVRRMSAASIGIGITGIAGPGGGTPEKPVGLVFIAIATPEDTWVFKYNFPRDRIWFKSVVAATALDLVRKHLIGNLL